MQVKKRKNTGVLGIFPATAPQHKKKYNFFAEVLFNFIFLRPETFKKNMEQTILKDQGLPQLRQMVLENTGRIHNNEQAIETMSKTLDEERRRTHDRDTHLDAALSEHDRAHRNHEREMQELRGLLRQQAVQLDESIKKSRKEFNESLQKSRKEFNERMGELQKSIDNANAAITRTSVEFLGVTGHIVEGLASSSTYKVFKDAGLNVVNLGKNIRPKDPSANDQMEIDVLLGNERFTIPVEVKANCTRQKVKRFVGKMKRFRRLFPEHSDKEVVAAIAAINFDLESDALAKELGLLVIRVSSDNIFSLDPFREDSLQRF